MQQKRKPIKISQKVHKIYCKAMLKQAKAMKRGNGWFFVSKHNLYTTTAIQFNSAPKIALICYSTHKILAVNLYM